MLLNNPIRKLISFSNKEIENLLNESINNYVNLSVYHKGESKEIRYTIKKGILIQRLIPSLSSITQKSKGIISETDILRNDISAIFFNLIHKHFINTCYLAKKNEFMLILEKKVPPIETIVKSALVGTPARIYNNIFSYKDRYGQSFIKDELHTPYVRFDYKNPLNNGKGEFLRDECLPVMLADRFINTKNTEKNVLKIFSIIQNALKKIKLVALDGCFIFDETGTFLCSEISPDNMRIKSICWHKDNSANNEYDKDLWRKRVEPEIIKSQWLSLKQWLEECL